VDALGLSDKDLETVTNDALAHTHAAFHLVGHTTEVASMLSDSGIDFLIIKGVALAALTESVGFRGAGDVDVLVDHRDIPRLHHLLDRHGYHPVLALPEVDTWQGRVWRWFDREATYLGHGANVDVHWRISSQHRLFPPFQTLHQRRTLVDVAGESVPTLGLHDSLAAACYHSYFDQFQPARSLVDVVSVLRALDDSPLPPYPRALRRLISGVVSLIGDLFPGVVDEPVDKLRAVLPPPPGIVRARFDQALHTPRVRWEEDPDRGALGRKFLSEAAFDGVLVSAPRFIGKRMFDFPHRSSSVTRSTLGEALIRRYKSETRRRPRLAKP
jgi:hypothetical protein